MCFSSQISGRRFLTHISPQSHLCFQVNGLLTHLPYRMGLEQIYVYRKGWNTVIQTGFGLTVAFEWQSRVTVTVPSAYAGALEGLCGNFNGDKRDDLMASNGGPNSAATALGQRWRVTETLGCEEASLNVCPDMEAIAQHQRGISAECGLLVDKTGPFRECHGQIDPEVFFLDCVYDSCLFKGQQAVLGHVIAAYATACQATWVTIYIWRIHIFWSKYTFLLYHLLLGRLHSNVLMLQKLAGVNIMNV